jgi:hypothetical protein
MILEFVLWGTDEAQQNGNYRATFEGKRFLWTNIFMATPNLTHRHHRTIAHLFRRYCKLNHHVPERPEGHDALILLF